MRKTAFWIGLVVLSACLTGKQSSADKKNIDPAPSEARIGCGPTPADLNTAPGYDGKLAPLFKGLDIHHYPISTKSSAAQKYFDQGLVLSYGFNHAEAARSFRQCAIEDPTCAMCQWGIAYVLGPNYNAPMEVDVLPAALEALQQARILLNTASEKERDLVQALSMRYPPNKETDPKPYYEAYASAMRGVSHKYPDDVDITAMTAEALMDLHPWDMWEKNGTPRPWTPEIVSIIEGALAKNPKHPQAAHLYIHATEASKDPEKALAAARMLAERVPGSGHLLHMPSHTFINTGHYHEGTVANERGVNMDSLYVASCYAAGIYPLFYYPHNLHMLTACAALEGDGAKALRVSRYMAANVVNKDMFAFPDPAVAGGIQQFYIIPWYIMVKFGMWDEIRKEPAPDPSWKYPLAMWNYAQGMANAARGNFDKAAQNLEILRNTGMDTSVTRLSVMGFNSVGEIMKVAEQVLQGEIVLRQGQYDIAARFFQQAVEIEDQLNYDEPPDWFFCPRHNLGDALLKAQKYEQAESVYRKDLEEFKNNGWALMGLYKSLIGQDRVTEAEDVMKKYKEAWKYATVQLQSSVL